MLVFPDPNVETEYTDPNGSVWEFNGTGWVRQCDCPSGPEGPTDEHWIDTYLLINADDLSNGSQDIVDATGNNALTIVGAPAADTSTFKYGTGSVKFISVNPKGHIEMDPFDMTKPWTMEAWVNRDKNFASQRGGVMSQWTGGAVAFMLWIDGSQRPEARLSFDGTNSSATITSPTATGSGTWHHVALCWDGFVYSLYLDGVRQGTHSSSQPIATVNTPFAVGAVKNSSGGTYQHYMSGYLDDIRVTAGTCRYLADFEPPDKAPTQPALRKPTVLSADPTDVFIGDNDVPLTTDIDLNQGDDE